MLILVASLTRMLTALAAILLAKGILTGWIDNSKNIIVFILSGKFLENYNA